ncbi:MAG: hypothetical protein OXF48_01790 [Bacteroidetes bacterium]|nr:hypothetical protein [Bacteroidota bacterium]
MQFTSERKAFDRLKSHCPSDSRKEFELASKELILSYNTTIPENRFIVGGAMEVFVCALLRSSDVSAWLYGEQSHGGDIMLPQDKKLSCKGTFTKGWSAVGLINIRGSGHREWQHATLFIRSGTGIVYGDPTMVDPKEIKHSGDQTALSGKALKELCNDPLNVMPLDIPFKPPSESTAASEVASRTVALEILRNTQSSKLLDLAGKMF